MKMDYENEIYQILVYAPLNVKGDGAAYVARKLNKKGLLMDGKKWTEKLVRDTWSPRCATMQEQCRADHAYQVACDTVKEGKVFKW
jgi:hypothetical protein